MTCTPSVRLYDGPVATTIPKDAGAVVMLSAKRRSDFAASSRTASLPESFTSSATHWFFGPTTMASTSTSRMSRYARTWPPRAWA